MEQNIFWYNDIKILLDKNELLHFIPVSDMTKDQKLNSIVRFSIYLSILLTIFDNNINYILIFIFTCAITYIVHIYDKDTFVDATNSPNSNSTNSPNSNSTNSPNSNSTKEDELTKHKFPNIKGSSNIINSNFDFKNSKECIKPTKDNPFMNVLPVNYKDFFNKNACKPSSEITKEIDNIFKPKNSDDNDPFDNNFSKRAFSTILDDYSDNSKDLRDWLYKKPVTCLDSNEPELETNFGCSILI